MPGKFAKTTLNAFFVLIVAIICLMTLPLSAEVKEEPSGEPAERALPVFSLAPVETELPTPLELYPLITARQSQGQASLDLRRKNQDIRVSAAPVRQKQIRQGQIGNTLYTTSMVSFVLLNLADYMTTKEALKYGSLGEGNPVLKPIVENDMAFAAVKIGLTLGNYLLMKRLYQSNKTLAWVVSIACNFAMSYIVAHNMKLINEARAR